MIRVFNVDTLQLAEFPDQNVPEYAILSHQWIAGQELTFHDLNRHLSESTDLLGRKRAGALKLKGACIVARTHGLHWIWIDTCCIDKSNSTELSEAINSMYSWYKHAKICLTYLIDVVLEDPGKTFEDSEWFHRCWTLQELIAPHDVEFYDANWDLIGTKLSLRKSIYDVTGIDMKVLNGGDTDTIPVGRRMSWMSSQKSSGVVASRAATYVEDEAYSLLGIFGVNMPLLYGEKTNAFKRLQEAILETIDDPSIFAWVSSSMVECHEKLDKFRSLPNWDKEKRKLLAREPGDFKTLPSWLSNNTSVADSPPPLITICDKLPNESAVLKAVFREFVGLIKNSPTLAMIIRHCTLKDNKVEAKLVDQLAEQLKVLARKLEHEAQDDHYLSATRFLHIHANDVAEKAVKCVVDAEYYGGLPHQSGNGPYSADFDPFAREFEESAPLARLRRLLDPEAQLDSVYDGRYPYSGMTYHPPGMGLFFASGHMLDIVPKTQARWPRRPRRLDPEAQFDSEYYGRSTYNSMPHQPEMGLSFADPSIFVASSRPYALFAQELIDTWRPMIWSHSRLREFLGQRMQGEKNQQNRNKHFLQFIELEFDLPTDTPKLMNSQTISVMDRPWHLYELFFGSRTSPLQSLQPGEVNISWKSTMWGLPKTIVIPEELQNEFIEFSSEVVHWSRKQNRESLFHKQQPGHDRTNFLFLAIPVGSEYHIIRLATHDMSELALLAQIKDSYVQTRGLLRFWFSLWHLDSIKLALVSTWKSESRYDLAFTSLEPLLYCSPLIYPCTNEHKFRQNGPNSAKVLHQPQSSTPKAEYEYKIRELEKGGEVNRGFHREAIRQLLLRGPQRYDDLDSYETSQESFIGFEVVERFLLPLRYLVLFALFFFFLDLRSLLSSDGSSIY